MVKKRRAILQDFEKFQDNSSLLKRKQHPSIAECAAFGNHPRKKLMTRCNLMSTTDCSEDQKKSVVVPGVRLSEQYDPEERGRLVTRIDGQKHIVRIRQREQAFTIGRHRTADLTLNQASVSNIHGRLYAVFTDLEDLTDYVYTETSVWKVESDTLEQLICYEDISSNGTIWNETLLTHQSVILNDLDSLQIGAQVFVYYHCSPAGKLSIGSHATAAQTFPPEFSVAEYAVTSRSLGSGAFSVVRLAVHCETNLQVACKIMPLDIVNCRKGLKQQIAREIRLLKQLAHPNVASFCYAAQDDHHVYIFAHLLTGGDLHTYIVRKRSLPGAEAKFILYQLMLGLNYLHNDIDIAHRDIKPENIMLRNHGPYPQIIISDFGAARISNDNHRSTSFVGTIAYWPPECFTSSMGTCKLLQSLASQCPFRSVAGYNGKALDCYSLGQRDISGRLPYNATHLNGGTHKSDQACTTSSTSDMDQLREPSSEDLRLAAVVRPDVADNLTNLDRNLAKAIFSGNMYFGRAFAGIDKDSIDLIRCLAASDYRVRYDIKGAIQHNWLAKSQNELDTLYAKNVRVTAMQPAAGLPALSSV